MKKLLLFISILTTTTTYAQKLTVTTADKSKVAVTLLDSASRSDMITKFKGKQNNELRKKWTARTYQLADGRILIEFYDRQAALVNNQDDFKRLADVRFVKNTLNFLKKNISYKIELDYNDGLRILQNEKPKRIDSLKSDTTEFWYFEVYQMSTGQLLFLDKTKNHESAAIYPDLKTLAAENEPIAEQVYHSNEDEYLMRRLAAGEALPDYEPDMQLVYPKYLKAIINSHQLTLTEQKVYVSEFYSNLYKSAKGYYMLIEEVDQKNGAGDKMQILSLYIYPTLQQVREAQNRYQVFKDKGVTSEHFYKGISDKYGQRFPEFVNQLIDTLPALLNMDKEQLSEDSVGMNLVDESLKWNYVNNQFLDGCFPSLLAYYEECYMKSKKVGKWDMILDKYSNVWIPMVKLDDGGNAWDWRHFYKDLYNGPVPLTWAGNWDGTFKYK